LFGGVPLRNH
jgi:1-pyrroline-5-carboxylate dehydrogenase